MPQQRRLAFGFVTYHPSADFLQRLALLQQLGQVVYLFDNSPDDPAARDAARALGNVTYITAGKNVGLGFALSTICAGAYHDSCASLQFFDQDTAFTPATIRFIDHFAEQDVKTLDKDYLAVVFAAGSSQAATTEKITDVTLAISSGSLFFLKNLKNIGWHNQTYFVDGVDYEICLRASINALRIGICHNTPGFDHVSEQPDQQISLFGKMLPVRRYSAARIKDALYAYLRLTITALRFGQLRYTGKILRSFLIYTLGQVISRFALR